MSLLVASVLASLPESAVASSVSLSEDGVSPALSPEGASLSPVAVSPVSLVSDEARHPLFFIQFCGFFIAVQFCSLFIVHPVWRTPY